MIAAFRKVFTPAAALIAAVLVNIFRRKSLTETKAFEKLIKRKLRSDEIEAMEQAGSNLIRRFAHLHKGEDK